jgi:hypothetical protein
MMEDEWWQDKTANLMEDQLTKHKKRHCQNFADMMELWDRHEELSVEHGFRWTTPHWERLRAQYLSEYPAHVRPDGWNIAHDALEWLMEQDIQRRRDLLDLRMHKHLAERDKLQMEEEQSIVDLASKSARKLRKRHIEAIDDVKILRFCEKDLEEHKHDEHFLERLDDRTMATESG